MGTPVQTTIISSSNRKVKYVRSLSRRSVRYRERHFVVEGATLLDEALRAGVIPALMLYTPEFAERPDASGILGRLSGAGVAGDVIESRLMGELADTVTPQGILAVVPFPVLPAPSWPALILLIDLIAVPGNLGTLLRSAEAAGVDLALVGPGSTDPFGPKAVRGGMGVHFRLPLRVGLDWDELRCEVAERPVYLADVGEGLLYYQVDWNQPSVLIVSSEAHGPSPEARGLATAVIRIPMYGQTESLNAGVAGSVILFEAARQRCTAANPMR